MWKLKAFQIADSIDIKQFKATFTAPLHFSDSAELFYALPDNQYIHVFKYGAICLCNHTDVEITGFLQMIQPFCRTILEEKLSDDFDIEIGSHQLVFGFDQVSIPVAETEMIRLIMMHVTQSVALDHFEQQTTKLMQETNSHTQVLEIKGKLDLSDSNLKKYIGKTLILKNKIAENIYIFDSPEETWEDENLNKLDVGLKRTFDVQSRFRTIEEGLAIVKENLELFKDMLQYRNSMLLEWIIIILIFVEVVNLFLEKIIGK